MILDGLFCFLLLFENSNTWVLFNLFLFDYNKIISLEDLIPQNLWMVKSARKKTLEMRIKIKTYLN